MEESRSQLPATSRARIWQEHIAAWEGSGQTRAAYCRQHGLNLHTFAYWRRRLREDPCALTLVQVAGVSLPGSRSASVRVVVEGLGLAIEVSDDFSPATLGRALAVVRGL